MSVALLRFVFSHLSLPITRNSCALRLGSLSLVCLALCGCQTHPIPAPVAPVSVRAAGIPPAVTHVQSSLLYQQARQSCLRHDYRHAADLLQTLAAAPGLAPEAVAFVQRQRTLCLTDAGLPATTLQKIDVAPTPSPQDSDCGPRALLLLCQRLGVKTDLPTLRKTAGTTSQGTTLDGLQQAAQKLGLKAEGVQVSREALPETQMPALAWVHRDHYVTLFTLEGNGDKATATIFDPNKPAEETLSQEQLLQRCGGYLLLVHR